MTKREVIVVTREYRKFRNVLTAVELLRFGPVVVVGLDVRDVGQWKRHKEYRQRWKMLRYIK